MHDLLRGCVISEGSCDPTPGLPFVVSSIQSVPPSSPRTSLSGYPGSIVSSNESNSSINNIPVRLLLPRVRNWLTFLFFRQGGVALLLVLLAFWRRLSGQTSISRTRTGRAEWPPYGLLDSEGWSLLAVSTSFSRIKHEDINSNEMTIFSPASTQVQL